MRYPRPSRALAPSMSAASLVLTLAALQGCHRMGDPSARVAAKVNDDSISIQQVDYVLQQRQGLSVDDLKAEQTATVGREALDRLVDQQLVLQAAADDKVDRDPAVLQMIESARREIIANAYTRHLAETASAPNEAEVRQYYDSRPALFSQRRVYTLLETAFAATAAQQKALTAPVQAARNAGDVTALLKQAGLGFGTRQSTVAAEALPLSAVDAMARLGKGQSHLVPGEGQAHVLTILEVEVSPLTPSQARASIERYLVGERQRERVQQRIQALRDTARIEYLGRFAPADESARRGTVSHSSLAPTWRSVAFRNESQQLK